MRKNLKLVGRNLEQLGKGKNMKKNVFKLKIVLNNKFTFVYIFFKKYIKHSYQPRITAVRI